MTRPATAAQIREFLERDWERVAQCKRASWRDRLQRSGPGALLSATEAILDYLRRIDSHWPDEPSRAADLEHLIRYKQRIDAASAAFNCRSRAR